MSDLFRDWIKTGKEFYCSFGLIQHIDKPKERRVYAHRNVWKKRMKKATILLHDCPYKNIGIVVLSPGVSTMIAFKGFVEFVAKYAKYIDTEPTFHSGNTLHVLAMASRALRSMRLFF